MSDYDPQLTMRDPNEGHATFLLIVFISFGLISFVCLGMSVFRLHRRKLFQQEQARLLEAHRLTRIVQDEEREDTRLRSTILKVIFPELTKNGCSHWKADCTHLMYDAESKSYEWTSDYGVLLDGSCSICLEVFDANDPVVSGKCGHPYHYECIVGWMQIKNECPYCRHPMWSKHTYENVKADIKGKTMILPDDDEEGSGRSYTINASSQSSLSE